MLTDRYAPPAQLRARVDLLRRSGREIESLVSGRSMEPAIPSGAHIRIAPGAVPVAIGTAVAIVTPGGLVAHRLIARGRFPWNRRFVLTQGDGSRFCDPPVPAELVLGEITGWRESDSWRSVSPPAPTARAGGWRASAWRGLVGLGFAIHPRLATALVRASLRGRVPEVAWSE